MANEAIAQTNMISKEIDVLKANGYWSSAIVKKLNMLLTGLKSEMNDISLRGEFGLFYVEGGLTILDVILDSSVTDNILRERICAMVPHWEMSEVIFTRRTVPLKR